MPASRIGILLGLSTFILVALCVTTPTTAWAQGKAYAPQDLRQLTVRERVRVIEREYADQSGGRAIPDDQLEFYLDQIDSGWAFRDIQNDIAQSLRGSNWRPPNNGWRARYVTCSSVNKRYTECLAPFRSRPVLREQLSSASCIENRTWGWKQGAVWVDAGCRGRFAEGGGGGPGHGGGHGAGGPGYGGPGYGSGSGSEVICESQNNRRQRCATGFRAPAMLVQQLSDSACIEGRTWGSSPGEVWVDNGCRGRFAPSRNGGLPGNGYGGGSSYSVTCISEDDRYRTCAWQERYGYPVLIEQISRTACVEGRTWGYRRGEIWVDQGCRARFGTR